MKSSNLFEVVWGVSSHSLC